MELKILLPYKVYANIHNVNNIVAETTEGSIGLLPKRLDCVAVLVPGIFAYTTDKVHYLALDEGVLVKAGNQVMVSVSNAAGGVALGKLAETIKNEFMTTSAADEKLKYMSSKLEKGFLSIIKKFQQV